MTRRRRKTSIFIYTGRLAFVSLCIVGVFCAIFARLYFLHVVRSDASIEATDKARKLFDKIPARRGNIVDSKDNLLATSRPVITIGADPERVEFDEAGREKLRKLAEILKMRPADVFAICTPYQDAEKIGRVKNRLDERQTQRLRSIGVNLNMTFEELLRKCLTTPRTELSVERRVEQTAQKPKVFAELARILQVPQKELERNFASFSPRWKKIAENLDDATYTQIRALKIKGIRGDRKYVRVYPSGRLTAHIVGFVNKEFSAEQGIEKQFDYYLHGQDGWIETERDGLREELVHYRSRDVAPTDGLNVELSIDSIIQEMANREVRNIVSQFNPKSATIIVSEPSTGYILAMASYPDFDPNEYNKAEQDSLRNRAICDQYEPGSTFKIVSISAALNESLVGPDDVFDCNAPTITYRGRVLRLPKEAHKMGNLTVREITKKSSNKGSAHLGILLGERKLYHYARLYGFGEKTDIGLVGEIGGTLHKVKDWDGLTITRLPMGHAVAVTPLQIHCAMSVIANQGIYMQPQLVKRVFDKRGETVVAYPPKALRRVIKPRIATLMSDMLSEVVSDTGTARRAALRGFKVAGKTGTSQKIINGTYSTRDHVASFTGFFPAQRPRLVITVVVDSPKLKGVGYGGIVAAPSFRNVAEQAANYLGIQTDEDYEKMVAWR